MWAKIITIKRPKDLNYFSLCALNLFNIQVSQFELNYWNQLTFPQHSNVLRCTCMLHIIYTTYTIYIYIYILQLQVVPKLAINQSPILGQTFKLTMINGFHDYRNCGDLPFYFLVFFIPVKLFLVMLNPSIFLHVLYQLLKKAVLQVFIVEVHYVGPTNPHLMSWHSGTGGQQKEKKHSPLVLYLKLALLLWIFKSNYLQCTLQFISLQVII